MILALLMSCATLDSFVFNAVPCSTVGPETCTEPDSVWDRFCTECPDAYAWDADYDWHETTLEEGERIRAIDPLTVTRIAIETEDGEGTLDAYFIPSHGMNPTTASTTIVYNHGNKGNLEHYLPRLRMLHEAGYPLFTWDFRGYGKSKPETTPDPDQFEADALTVYEEALGWATDPERVVVYGFSLGAIPAIGMALDSDPCALLLEAPFTSLELTAEGATGVGLGEQMLSEAQYDNMERIKGWKGPLFAFIGNQDRTFPPEDVRALARASGGPSELWIVKGAGHGLTEGGVPEVGLTPYLERIEGFLGQHDCLTP